jgi:hypothetical protein
MPGMLTSAPLLDCPPQVVIPGTLALARRLGCALLHARRCRQDPAAAAVAAYGGGQVIFRGKVRRGGGGSSAG